MHVTGMPASKSKVNHWMIFSQKALLGIFWKPREGKDRKGSLENIS